MHLPEKRIIEHLCLQGSRDTCYHFSQNNPVGHYDALSDKVVTALLFPKAGCVFQTPGARDFQKKLEKNQVVILTQSMRSILEEKFQRSEQRKLYMLVDW